MQNCCNYDKSGDKFNEVDTLVENQYNEIHSSLASYDLSSKDIYFLLIIISLFPSKISNPKYIGIIFLQVKSSY